MKHKLITLALVLSLVFVSQNTFSLGMGKIQVNSALDEPLNASIDIIANNDESIDQVSVKLASSDDYKKVGLDKSFVPANIMVSVDEDNPYQINVRSNGPVSEPIVSLLLDVKWANGRILREFTLLLDPPSYQASTRGSVTMPVTQPEPQQPDTMAEVQDDVATAQSDDIPPVSQDLNEAYEEANTEVAETDQDDSEFTVETPMQENVSETVSVMPGEVYVNAGDTLWRIANQNKPGEITTHQMMMAIYDKNPNAFINNNINEMIKGSTLQMPDADSADDLSYAEALAAFESHNSRWATADDSYSSFQTESQLSDEETLADSTEYGVQLSGGEGDDADSQQTEGDLADSGDSGLSDEEAFNASSENEDLKSRVSELETIVNEQQSALEFQDDDLANLENQMAQDSNEEDTLTEGDFDGAPEESAGETITDETLSDDRVADDVWGTDVAEDDLSDETTDSASELLDGELTDEVVMGDDVADTDDSMGETVASEDSVEDVDAQSDSVVTTPSQPWYTAVMNWVEQNILWVIIGLVVLFLIVLLPRLFNRGDEDPVEESSFLDDIKSSRSNQEDDVVEADANELDEDEETVLTTPIAIDGDDIDDDSSDDESLDSVDEESDDDDDVLAELDNSLAFDDSDDEDDGDEFDFDFDDDESAETEESDDDLVDDLGYETPTKEYDPEPFKDIEDSSSDDFDDDFDLSELDDELAGGLDDDDKDKPASDEEDTSFLDDDDFDLEAELSELDDDELEATDLEADEDQSEEASDEADDFSDDDFLDELDTIEDLDEESDEVEVSDDKDEAIVDADESDEADFEDTFSLAEDDQATTFETEQEDDDMDDDIDLGLDDLMDDGDVIETKLDLAKAYIEMGDTEGAKNLLDEVKAEGSEAQQSEADKLLDDM